MNKVVLNICIETHVFSGQTKVSKVNVYSKGRDVHSGKGGSGKQLEERLHVPWVKTGLVAGSHSPKECQGDRKVVLSYMGSTFLEWKKLAKGREEIRMRVEEWGV